MSCFGVEYGLGDSQGATSMGEESVGLGNLRGCFCWQVFWWIIRSGSQVSVWSDLG